MTATSRDRAGDDGPVLVTGATGNVGRCVVAALVRRGIPVRAGGRDAAATAAEPGGVETVRLDFTEPGTFAPALDGCAGLFLLRPPAISRVGPTLNTLIDEAARRGIGHVVFSSVAGADTNRIVPHHRVETHLRASRLAHTILRPGFFAQNIGDQYRRDIVHDDRIVLPAGDGRVAFVDVRDVGEVAAAVFADPAPHRGAGYTLTGPEAVTFDTVADLLAEAVGRPVRYRPVGALRSARHLRSQGLPLPQVLVQVVLHVGLRRGDAEDVDPTLARLLGRRPRTVAEYIGDHVDLWRRPV